MPGPLAAQGGPWAQRPAGTPQKLTFVVWQYGKIYEQIAKQFEDDWGVKLNQIIEPNVEPQVAKLTTMFGAGDEVDVRPGGAGSRGLTVTRDSGWLNSSQPLSVSRSSV